jgi:GAF domain-containing protein
MNQSPDNIDFSYTNWRASFLRITLIGASIFGLVAVIPGVIGASDPIYAGLYIGVYLTLLLITILPVPNSIKAGTLTVLIFSLGILGLSESGIRGDAPVFMLGAITMSSLLFSWKTGWAVTALAMFAFVISGWLVTSGTIAITSQEVTPGNVETWASGSTSVLLLAAVIVNGIRLTQNEFGKAQNRAQAVLDVIQDEKFTLEQRVEKRTQDLAKANQINEHRAKMFQAIAQVTRAIISTQNLQDLLPQITQAISQYFDFYHVGIFLISTNKEYAVLSAANSEGGQRMLERNHKLRVGQVGIVGYVAGAVKPRIALDTGADAIYFNNPDLPETRSEMALPLIQANGQIIGVLDIQSIESNAFNREDIEILITLADQVSVAIANARLYEETQKSLIEAEMLYRRDLQIGWKKYTHSQQIAGVRRIGMNANLYTESMELPGATEVINSGSSYYKNDENSQTTIPVKLRGEIVGMLSVKTDEERKWSGDEMDIITAIVERAALSIESARLLEESRVAAEKERAIGEISTKISANTQVEMILKTAIRELGKQIGDARISVEIGIEDE